MGLVVCARARGQEGELFINGESASWSSSNSRWELNVSSSNPATKTYSVSSIDDDQFDLIVFSSDVTDVDVEWKQAGIPSFPLESIVTALVLLGFYLRTRNQ